MKRLTILALGVGFALLLHDRALAWVQERVLGNDQTEWRDFWPPGLRDLAAGPGRVHGRHMIAHSFGKGHERWAFYFRGGPQAFHRFITRYTALKQGEFSRDAPLALVLHVGKGEVQPLMGKMGDRPAAPPGFDWLLRVSAHDIRTDHPQVRVSLDLWISSSFPLHQVKVPREIQVTTPLDAFIKQHEEKRLENNVTALQQRVAELRRELAKAEQQLEQAKAAPAKGTDTAEIPPGATDEQADTLPASIQANPGGEIEKTTGEPQGLSSWGSPGALPELDKDAAKGLKIECHPSKAEYRVGDRAYVVCEITNETDGIKPVAWNANVGSHFTLIQGDKFSLEGLLPRAHPEIPKPLLVKSGHPPTTERILYLPPGDSIVFHLSVGKAQRPLIFKGRVAYDPLAPRATFWIDPKKTREECLFSDLFTYEVVDADRKQATSGESKTGHGINIYFLQDVKMDFQTARKKPLSELVLRKEPWIASDDIDRYDVSTHRIYLRKKFSAAPWKNLLPGGTPFVVVANGRRCYLGTLWPSDSSALPRENVPFITDVPVWTGGGQSDAIQISLISVLRSGEDVVDVRSDPRILEAAREHHSGDR